MKNIIALYLLFVSSFTFAAPAKSTKQILNDLYSDMGPRIVEQKINKAGNPHEFYRAFVRYYYYILKSADFKDLARLSKDEGIISGDPHIENFGTMINQNDGIYFGLNDFDDVTKGPFVHDFIRFLSSVKLSHVNYELKDLLKNYEDGLKGESHIWSKEYEEILAKAKEKGRILSKDIDLKKKKFINFKDLTWSLSELETKDWKSILEKEGLSYHDGYRRAKDGGGSAGLTRYEILASKGDTLYWLSYKKIITSAVKVFTQKDLIPAEKLKAIKTKIVDGKIPEIKSQLFQNENYFFHYEWTGNRSVQIKDYSESKKISGLVNDEAYMLGQMHARSLPSKKLVQMEGKLYALTVEQFDDFSNRIVAKMESAFRELKKP